MSLKAGADSNPGPILVANIGSVQVRHVGTSDQEADKRPTVHLRTNDCSILQDHFSLFVETD